MALRALGSRAYISIKPLAAVLSLSTVVLNSRDRHENVWLPKNMRLEKQPF